MPTNDKTKTEAKHTPGPWKVSTETARVETTGMDTTFVTAGNDKGSDGLGVAWIPKHCPNVEADARLIAAAPDLLRFVRAIDESAKDAMRPGSRDTFMTLIGRLRDYRKWARVALAKAEGR